MSNTSRVYEIRIEQGQALSEFEKLNRQLEDNKARRTELNRAVRENIKQQKVLRQELQKEGADTRKITSELQRLEARRVELNREQSRAAIVNKDLSATMREQSNDLARLTERNIRFRDKMAQSTLEAIKKSGVLTRLDARSRQYAEALNRLEVEMREGRINAQQYRTELQRLEGQVNSLGNRVGGSVANSFRTLATSYVGVGALIFGVGRAVGSAISKFADFDKANSKLAGLLAKTREETQKLTDTAKQLGGTTAFTATQVTELQIELAKLGFTEGQILDAQAAILDLAAAADADLATAAEVAARNINAFGLEASDTQRVVDVMAKSFSSSALDLERFSTAMENAAPAARAVGLSVEETTALLSVLVDNGIDASKAGTDLRTVFIKLKEQGLTLEQAIEAITGSQDQLTKSVELFDVRAAASGLVIANNVGRIAELRKAYDSAEGSAGALAAAQLDNLRGDQLILTSAWEGFVFSVEDGSGVISGVLRDTTESFTNILNALTDVNDSTKTWRERVGALIGSALGPAGPAFRQIISAVYGTRDAFNVAKASTEELEAKLKEVNATLEDQRKTLNNAPNDEWRKHYQGLVKENEALKKSIEDRLRLDDPLSRSAQDQVSGVESIQQARDRLTAAINAEKVARDALAVTDLKGREQIDLNIDALEKELEALDAAKKGVEELTKAQQKNLEQRRLQQEMADLAGQDPQQMDGLSPLEIAEGAQTPVDDPYLESIGLAYEARLQGAQDITDELLALYQEEQDAFEELNQAKLESMAGFAQALRGLVDESEGVAKVLFAIEKAAAIASVVQSGIDEVAKVRAAFAAKPPVAEALAAAAKVRTGVAVAGLVSQALAFAEGGEVSSKWGPRVSRSNGDNRLVRTEWGGFATLKDGEVVLNEKQQNRVKRLTGQDIRDLAALPGLSASKAARGVMAGYNTGGIIQAPPTSIESADVSRGELVSALRGLSEQEVVVLVEDIDRGLGRKALVEELSRSR